MENEMKMQDGKVSVELMWKTPNHGILILKD